MTLPLGAILWLAAGLAAWAVARLIPSGRPPGWGIELLLALVAASAAGLAATALDFGGTHTLEWRAALFAAAAALTAIAVFRLIRLRK